MKGPRPHKGGTRPTPKAQRIRYVLTTMWTSDEAKQRALKKAKEMPEDG